MVIRAGLIFLMMLSSSEITVIIKSVMRNIKKFVFFLVQLMNLANCIAGPQITLFGINVVYYNDVTGT